MNCSCRTAALRIFVNNIAHINVPTIVAAARLASRNPLSNPLRNLQSLGRSAAALPISASRSLHTTPYRSNRPRKPSAAAGAGADRKSGKPPFRRPGKPGGRWPGKPDRRPKGGAHAPAPAEEASDEPRKPSLHQLRIEEQDEAGMIRNRTDWKVQKAALKEKFPDGWQPRKKLSPDALTGIRALHAEFPDIYTTEELANKFEVSAENIRRILRSKWVPSVDEEVDRQERWFNRGKKVWSRWAELGKKPPRRWRAEGIVRDPIWNEKRGEGDKKSARRRASEAHKKLSESLM
ncbi:hypothetical protein B0T18DRAFT_332716 [Schizothecium vesticola]|uniref:Required for respiratory growth protein 9, mitochondrial n=1 Tax=Schizothecium vesticola TaxID=314040 RepID=A0AA40JYZ9_9PEZI|nr:hypothetical protein B0T18DRAFT_332716 [Schizothecium vesticola]